MEHLNSVDTSELKKIAEKFNPFMAEVRKRLIIIGVVFGLSSALGFFFSAKIIRTLITIMSLDNVNLVFTAPFQYITLSVSTGLATGFILTFPLILKQILSFLKPALRKQEYKVLVKYLPYSMLLFLVGFCFGLFAMKWQIDLLVGQSKAIGIGNVLDISKLLNTIIVTSTFMGISFQFPIILLILLKLGIVSKNQLAAKRKWVYLGSFIFAILLPADSVLVDIILALPLVILFETTLLLTKSKVR